MHFILIRPLFSRGCHDHMVVCNQCLSPLTLRVRIPLGPCVLDTTLCDEVCQWLAAGFLRILQFPSPTDRNDISEILLKVAFKYHHPNPFFYIKFLSYVTMFQCSTRGCFIGGGNRRKPLTGRKSLTIFYHIMLYWVLLAMSGFQARNVCGVRHLIAQVNPTTIRSRPRRLPRLIKPKLYFKWIINVSLLSLCGLEIKTANHM